MKEKHVQTYDRYKTEGENSFLVVFHAQGLDGTKTNVLELATALDDVNKKIGKSGSSPELVKDEQSADKEFKAAVNSSPPLEKWWQTAGAPHKVEDLETIKDAGLFGGRMALKLTAAVPATMAVLYLLLILYFKATGGYKKEVVLTTAAPASEF